MTDEPITLRDLQNAVSSATLATQMAEVIKDVGELGVRMNQHEHRHDQEKRERIVQRRWLIGILTVLFSAIETPLITILIEHMQGGH